jgi:hypothetical protein
MPCPNARSALPNHCLRLNAAQLTSSEVKQRYSPAFAIVAVAFRTRSRTSAPLPQKRCHSDRSRACLPTAQRELCVPPVLRGGGARRSGGICIFRRFHVAHLFGGEAFAVRTNGSLPALFF